MIINIDCKKIRKSWSRSKRCTIGLEVLDLPQVAGLLVFVKVCRLVIAVIRMFNMVLEFNVIAKHLLAYVAEVRLHFVRITLKPLPVRNQNAL